MSKRALPMFPLQSVLFPTMVLPLHVFEPRYRALAHQVTSGGGRFGVVLIERGSEVGGDDVRRDIGTVAEVVESEELPDGRWALVAVGRRRIRVERWLADDPFPQAVVASLEDERTAGGPDLGPLLGRLRRALALQAELGEARAPVGVELSPDPATASMQMGAIGPFGPADQQRILEATDVTGRVELLDELLADATELLEHRLAGN